MPNAFITILDANNEPLKEVQSDDEGRFVFEDMPKNSTYTIATTTDEYQEDVKSVTAGDEDMVSVDISLKRLDEMIISDNGVKMLKTDNIYFNFDGYSIRKDAKIELDKLVKVWDIYFLRA